MLNHAQPPGSFTSRYISSSSTDAPQLLPELTPLVDGDTRQSFLWRPSGWSSRSHSNCSVSRVVIITFIYIYNMLYVWLVPGLVGFARRGYLDLMYQKILKMVRTGTRPKLPPLVPVFFNASFVSVRSWIQRWVCDSFGPFLMPAGLVPVQRKMWSTIQLSFKRSGSNLTWPKTFQNQNKTTRSYCNNHLLAFHGLSWHPSAETLGQSTREHLHCKLWRMEKLPVCCADTTGSSERRFRREMDPDWSDPVKCWPKDHISHLISNSWSDILHTMSLHVPLYVLMGSDGYVP